MGVNKQFQATYREFSYACVAPSGKYRWNFCRAVWINAWTGIFDLCGSRDLYLDLVPFKYDRDWRKRFCGLKLECTWEGTEAKKRKSTSLC